MTDCTQRIIVSEYFPQSSLITRESATELMKIVNEREWYHVEIDFSGINFISRSFADQFHKEKVKLWEVGKKEIVVTNAQNDVMHMLKAVSKTQDKDSRPQQSFNFLHFQSRQSLKEYLLSI